jgi:hypothetical protein
MPQNPLVGWRFAWPKWLTGSQAVNKQYVDAMVGLAGSRRFVNATGDRMSGPLVLHGDPVTPTHAATKQYVDNRDIDVGTY